jgi:hypothetical protein
LFCLDGNKFAEKKFIMQAYYFGLPHLPLANLGGLPKVRRSKEKIVDFKSVNW